MLPLLLLVALADASSAAPPSYPNFTVSTLTVDGRDVDAYVPDCAHANSPIIMTLHAWATSKEMQKSVDRLPAYAGAECAVIVYPQGKARGEMFGMVGFSWNAGGCCPNANLDEVDDVGFLGHVVTAVAKKFTVNENLVLAVGVSNGGMMASRFACENDKVKAVVSVSGPIINGTGTPKSQFVHCARSVPLLQFHGEADAIVPYNGCVKGHKVCDFMAAMGGFPPLPWPTVPEVVATWRETNGIPSNSDGSITFTNGTSSCRAWGANANNVTFCTLPKEGHAWPGQCAGFASMLPGMHCSLDIDASQETMAFFRRYIPAPAAVIV